MAFNAKGEETIKLNNGGVKARRTVSLNSKTRFELELEHKKHIESGGVLGKFFGIDTNKSIIYSGICICVFGIIIRMIFVFIYKYFWSDDLDVKFLDSFLMLVAGYIFGSNRRC